MVNEESAGLRAMTTKKVLVIGLDGATWDLIEPWTRENKLPAFKKLMVDGCYGALESTIPHVTPPAWTSMTSGKNPAKHGIFDFTMVEKDKGGWKSPLYTSMSKHGKEVWDYLPGKSIIVNIPLTYPPRRINGIMVTGMNTPGINSTFTYPSEIKKKICSLFPEYIIDIPHWKYEDNKQAFITDLYKMTEERIKLFWHFFEYDWSFFFFVFVGTDRIQHIFWEDDELLKYYTYLDTFLSNVIKRINEEDISLFMVSDHGFSKIKKRVHINSVLQQEGYLQPKQRHTFDVLGRGLFSKEKLMEIIIKYNLFETYSRLPQKILLTLKKTVPGRTAPLDVFDLNNSEAVMVGTGSIFITTEAVGQKRKDIERKIIDKLENLTDSDTGERIIEKVYMKEELYSGRLFDRAPDLVILPKKGYTLVQNVSNEIIERPGFKKGDHALNGIFLAYGFNIFKNKKTEHIKIYDITPTILHIFGLPIPEDIDGRVIKEIFRERSEPALREVKYQHIDRERENIKAKLKRARNLGKL